MLRALVYLVMTDVGSWFWVGWLTSDDTYNTSGMGSEIRPRCRTVVKALSLPPTEVCLYVLQDPKRTELREPNIIWLGSAALVFVAAITKSNKNL